MEFTEILHQYRQLGGTARNIELRSGYFGRGLFPINPDLPIEIVVPNHLLISPKLLHLDESKNLRIEQKLGLDPQFISFYESYQRYFGWGNGGLEEQESYYSQLKSLSKKLKQFLLLFGWLGSDFEDKTVWEYLQAYFVCRQIGIENESKLMPFLELINHSPSGKQFIVDDGVHVQGVFHGEVLTCYRKNLDAFHFFRNYHFASDSSTFLSCIVKIKAPNIGTISISRFDSMAAIKDGAIIPKITKEDSTIHIAFLELANTKVNLSPRKLFAEQMQKFQVNRSNAYAVFDGLVHHNRKVLEDMIDECRLNDSRLAKELELVATNQLNLLLSAL